jgi:multisubunit Na+/H+ antiporter MnhE subunit
MSGTNNNVGSYIAACVIIIVLLYKLLASSQLVFALFALGLAGSTVLARAQNAVLVAENTELKLRLDKAVDYKFLFYHEMMRAITTIRAHKIPYRS